MIGLQKEIRKLIEDKLNEYSVDDIKFKVALYQDKIDDDMLAYEQENNSYNVSRYRYIPVTIEDINAEYSDIPKLKQLEGDLVLSFLVPTDQKDVENTLIQNNTEGLFKTWDNLVDNLNGTDIPLGNVGYQLYDDSVITINTDNTPDLQLIEFEITPIEGEGIIIEGDNFSISYDNDGIHCGTLNLPLNFNEINNVRVEWEGGIITLKVNGEETSTGVGFSILTAVNLKINQIDGLFHFLGVSNVLSEEYDLILIEDFKTLENNTQRDLTISTNEEHYGAVALGDLGNLTFSFRLVYPTTNQFTYGSEALMFQVYTTAIGINNTKNMIMGNHFQYYLDGKEIYPLSYISSYTTERYSTQKVLNKTSTTNVTDNVIGQEFTMFYENTRLAKDILRHGALKEKEQNKTYTLTVHYGSFKEDYIVKIEQSSTPPVYNSVTTISFTVGLAE